MFDTIPSCSHPITSDAPLTIPDPSNYSNACWSPVKLLLITTSITLLTPNLGYQQRSRISMREEYLKKTSGRPKLLKIRLSLCGLFCFQRIEDLFSVILVIRQHLSSDQWQCARACTERNLTWRTQWCLCTAWILWRAKNETNGRNRPTFLFKGFSTPKSF